MKLLVFAMELIQLHLRWSNRSEKRKNHRRSHGPRCDRWNIPKDIWNVWNIPIIYIYILYTWVYIYIIIYIYVISSNGISPLRFYHGFFVGVTDHSVGCTSMIPGQIQCQFHWPNGCPSSSDIIWYRLIYNNHLKYTCILDNSGHSRIVTPPL